MRVWKTIPLFVIIFTVNACSDSSKDEEYTASADASAPVTAPAPAPAPRPAAPATPRNDAPARVDAPARPVERIETFTIPAGSEVTVILSDPLNSGKNRPGDEFESSLAAPLSVDSVTLFDRGTKVTGKVSDVEDSGRVKGLANMRLTLMSFTHNGKTIPITTKSYFVEAEATKGRDAAVVGGGAGIGAAIGAIAGGKKGAAKGAAIGGAAGGGTVLATKGKEVDFPAESKLTFVLADDLSVRR